MHHFHYLRRGKKNELNEKKERKIKEATLRIYIYICVVLSSLVVLRVELWQQSVSQRRQLLCSQVSRCLVCCCGGCRAGCREAIKIGLGFHHVCMYVRAKVRTTNAVKNGGA